MYDPYDVFANVLIPIVNAFSDVDNSFLVIDELGGRRRRAIYMKQVYYHCGSNIGLACGEKFTHGNALLD